MARLLQDRLRLASFKAKHGWENLNIDDLEPKVELELERKRKRSAMSDDTVSDAGSDGGSFVSEEYYDVGPMAASTPVSAPFFSEGLHGSRSSPSRHRRHARIVRFSHSTTALVGAAQRSRHRPGSMSAPRARASRGPWEDVRHLAHSSPIYHRQYARYPVAHPANQSFISSASTIPDEPGRTGATSSDDEEEDDEDLPLHSFQARPPTQMRSSPPRTPPPHRHRSARYHHRRDHVGSSAARELKTGEEGADLLLYLATSPSPAQQPMRPRVFQPSTPPSRNTVLPSSMMTTPTGAGFMTFGPPHTPAQPFNMSDYVNITPSPAQGAWLSRTPVTAKTPPSRVKTPLAAKEARRKLNFDALLPPPPVSSSPRLHSPRALLPGGNGPPTGLGMELGGELGA